MKNKLFIPIVILIIVISFVYTMIGNNNGTKDTIENEIEESSPTIESNLVGNWYCSEINSCNDMKIFLNITQEGNQLYFSRDMKSESGVGESLLEGTADVIGKDTAYADFTKGDYRLDENGYLIEYFASNDRWNIYTKDFVDEPIDGNYRSKND